MSKADFIVRKMQLNDIEAAMKLSTAEGWNQVEKDWKLLIENPGNICMVAGVENKVAGTITAMIYENKIAWIGMMLVHKEHRGRGISKSLLATMFKKLNNCRSIKLDATPAGQKVYEKLDFAGEYTVARMTNMSLKSLPIVDDTGISPEPARLEHIEEMIAMDEKVFGANRAGLIGYLIKEYPDKAWILKRNNRIAGFLLGREGSKYHQVGPVVASGTNDAKILISKSLTKLTNEPVVMDVLCDKEELSDWLYSIGFIRQRHFTRMYKKENPFPGTNDNQFLIAGPEFG